MSIRTASTMGGGPFKCTIRISVPKPTDRYAGQLPQRRGRVGLCGRSCGNAQWLDARNSAADPLPERNHARRDANNPDADWLAARFPVVETAQSRGGRVLSDLPEVVGQSAGGTTREGRLVGGVGGQSGPGLGLRKRTGESRQVRQSVAIQVEQARIQFAQLAAVPRGVGWRHHAGCYLRAIPGTLELRRVPDPTPPHDGVVVRVKANGICRSDWHGWQGRDPDIRLPHVPGHELAG